MRDKILKILLKNADNYVSGEMMAQELGISRAAVWKHMDMLKKLGCEVESKQNRGYCLKSLPDLLAPEIIRSVDFSSEAHNRDIRHFTSLESTNVTAMELAMDGAAHGTIVIAEEQTKGKGRMAREWYAPAKEGIYMSIILRPSMSPLDAPKISVMAALAVARTVMAQSKIKVNVKWPNDVLSGARKICGILTEMITDMDRISYVVCGIGLNVNQEDFPENLHQIATSLAIQSGKKHSRPQLVVQIISEFFDIYNEYEKTGDFAPMITEYTRLSVVLHQTVEITNGKKTDVGKCIGFDRDGAIVLELANGKRRRYVSGEVSLRSEKTHV